MKVKILVLSIILGFIINISAFAQPVDLSVDPNWIPTNFTQTGNTLTMKSVINNTGGFQANNFRIGYYLTTDIITTTSDYFVGSENVSTLGAYSYYQSLVIVDLTTVGGLPNGTYYLGVIADDQSVIFESDENNNDFTMTYDNVIYPNTVGIVQLNYTDITIAIYPNPTTGKFTVQGTVSTIQVYDLFGRLVLRTNKPEIDMSSYPAGLYIWSIGTERGKIVLE